MRVALDDSNDDEVAVTVFLVMVAIVVKPLEPNVAVINTLTST